MTKFNYCGIEVEVEDAHQAAKVADVVAGKTYSAAALDRAAPGMMLALRHEHKSCQDVGVIPTKFTVVGGKVKSAVNPDRRHMKAGTPIGNR